MRIILLGPPGAGKGTQSQFICDTLQIPQISTGDMLRAAVASGSELGQEIAELMSAGELVSDEIIIRLVEERILQPDCESGYLLDGFPRTSAQAEALRRQEIKIDVVIHFEVPDDVIVDRICGRLIHEPSGRIYHREHNPPQQEGKDDVTGEPLIHRNDDDEETVRQRLEVYHEMTSPLIHYYREWSETGDALAPQYFSISGVGDVESIKREILEILRPLQL